MSRREPWTITIQVSPTETREIDVDAYYEEWERKVKAEAGAEAKAEAICEGVATGVRALCQRLDIELTHERNAQLATLNEEQLLDLLIKISESREWPRS